MKILLDENLPKKLKKDFSEHEIYTVTDKNWNGRKNGELLALMLSEGFDVLMTFDQNLEHQQNFTKYPIAVFILVAQINTYEVLSGLINKINTELAKKLEIGVIHIERSKR
jgi:predicted nuclease of predicted toxin-antitoxin system